FFWTQKIKLCELDSVCFHWADSDESCLNILKLIEKNPQLKEEYQKKVNSLNALKEIPIWLKHKRGVIERSMFDLYQDHILGESALSVSNRIEVSFLSGHGPFDSIVLSDLFHPVMYQEFVMVLLLTGKLSRRSFRLRFKTRLLLEQNHSVHLVNLEQMSPHGILLSSEKPIIEGKINFFLDHTILKETKGMDLSEMRSYLFSKANSFLYSAHSTARISINTKGIKSQIKFDFMKRKLYYYFVNFDRFENHHAAQTLQEFVSHSKGLIEESLLEAS
ncbi:MAG: hypothetical protein WDA09_09875, partial [Bacteriovoracaceae bacterium]